jgi:hypothetical protein
MFWLDGGFAISIGFSGVQEQPRITTLHSKHVLLSLGDQAYGICGGCCFCGNTGSGRRPGLRRRVSPPLTSTDGLVRPDGDPSG